MILASRLQPLFTLCGVLAVLCGQVVTTPARAQQDFPPTVGQQTPAPLELPHLPKQHPSPGEKFGDWVKRCEAATGDRPQRCFISQLVVLAQNDKRRNVLFVAMGYLGSKKTPGVILRVPLALGTYLPAGLVLSVPGTKPMRIMVDPCLPGGCNAAAKLPPEIIAAMQKANRGTVELHTIRKQKLVLPISFKGFTAGFASLGNG